MTSENKIWVIDLKECFSGKERQFLELQSKVDRFDLALHEVLKFLKDQEELNVYLDEVKGFYSHVLELVLEILNEVNRLMEVKRK